MAGCTGTVELVLELLLVWVVELVLALLLVLGAGWLVGGGVTGAGPTLETLI